MNAPSRTVDAGHAVGVTGPAGPQGPGGAAAGLGALFG